VWSHARELFLAGTEAPVVVAPLMRGRLHDQAIGVALGDSTVRTATNLVGREFDGGLPARLVAHAPGRRIEGTQGNVNELAQVGPVQRFASRGIRLEPDRGVCSPAA